MPTLFIAPLTQMKHDKMRYCLTVECDGNGEPQKTSDFKKSKRMNPVS